MDRLLDIFRALGDPTRLRIFALLRRMELSVGELAQVLGQSQPRVSRHVRILADAGLTTRRREGSWVFLALAEDPRNEPLLAAIEQVSGDWAEEDAARLAQVRAERAEAAARYFEARAEEWDAIRSLYVPEQQVESAMTEMLCSAPVGRLVDLGTGTGRMLEVFGVGATRALGVDRSPEMLRLARAKLSDAVPSAELRQGDLTALPLSDAIADTVILHQVLHFVTQPGAALAEAARLVADGGRMLIVDFAPHEKEELRTRDAHQRLGFSDQQIAGWLQGGGLDLVQVKELEGGELTVKLWLAERPSLRRKEAA
ncbi:metalloregulator ArsR/SmtB family transcription factor [Sphingomonas sp.]|uniref:ArsR/SmtB family transcription factor n=1 Tax=Sphingomonas sp. TaxID=28214 RepID=UPI002DF2F929|nr:metalloregulator ArsR/SmtB family transcription factor [Sphingomonas sp.]